MVLLATTTFLRFHYLVKVISIITMTVLYIVIQEVTSAEPLLKLNETIATPLQNTTSPEIQR